MDSPFETCNALTFVENRLSKISTFPVPLVLQVISFI